MSTIGLRTYLNQLRDLVQDEQYDEAILHARHILRYFPKYLPIYKILGEIYLRKERYTEAEDLFLRVLAAVPDDDFAHLGMAAIREEQGNLDAAIWHLERALEAQPNNYQLQEEIRRLYREREGVTPPRIHFTRAALARLYMRNGLYPQAIWELRAALHENPRRLDLQTLLAEAYFRAGEDEQALKTAQQVLQRLPYSLVANRIMATLLAKQGKDTEAERYRSRLAELDPYEALVDERHPTADSVPDDAIQVPKLTVALEEDEINVEGDIPSLPDVSAVQVDTGFLLEVLAADEKRPLEEEETASPTTDTEPEEIPLQGITTEEVRATEELQEPASEAVEARETEESSKPEAEATGPYVPPEKAEELIPEWMKAAGWAPRDPSIDLDEAALAAEEAWGESEEEGEVAPGEMPEWLKALQPEIVEQDQSEASEGHEETGGLGDWVLEAEAAAEAEAPAAQAEVQVPEEVFEDEEAALAWLEQLAAKQGAPLEELVSFREGEAEAPEATAEPEAEAEAPAVSQAEPEAEAPAIEEGEGLPDWLTGLAPEAATEPEPEAAAEAWLPLGDAEAAEDETAIPPMEGLAKVTAELLSEEGEEAATQEAEEPADWLQETPQEPSAAVPGVSEAWAPEPEVAEAPSETEETHAGFDWVEEVVQKADEEVEVSLPDWVRELQVPPRATMPLKPLPEGPDKYRSRLKKARQALADDQLDEALKHYRFLVRRGKFLDQVIEDLQQAQYYYPMSIDLLQLLGDALQKKGRLQEALDVYLQAEELLQAD
ncbi:MAG: tetratricopeptide repeat protein [Chloroflexi bacterium]|nr:tetratricopeptide repeat protein [Chloroflexota bacterium]